MKQLYIFIFAVCILQAFHATGQERPKKDTAKKDSILQDTSHITEKLILQHQEQSIIDSAVRQQLQSELKMAAGDAGKTRELQAQLNKIAARDSLRRVEQLRKIDSLKKNAIGYPVILNYDTLFYLYARIGSFSAEDRAGAVSQRIGRLYKMYSFFPDSLFIVPTENGYDMVYRNDLTIMSISLIDALWANTSTDSLAQAYHTRITSVVIKEREANSLQNWFRRFGLMALVLAGLILLIFLINKLYQRSGRFIREHRGSYLKGLTVRSIRLLSPDKLEQFVLGVNKFLRIVTIAFSVYLALLISSGIFAVTEKWTDTLLSWILTPAKSAFRGIIDFMPNLFTILVIYFIIKYAIRGIRYLSTEVEKERIQLKGFHKEWAHPTYNILKFLLYAFLVILIFPYLPGSDSPSFKGVSVFLGILISLGSSSAITNLVAGLVITYMRPFKIGDRVRIGEVTGDVMEKNMLVTRIRTIKNEDITVPNATVLSSSTINYSTNTKPEEKGLILHTTVTIGYDVPWKDMHQALIEAANRTAFLLKDPPPFVLQTSLDDFYVSYQLNAYTREANKQASIYSELHQHIQDSCNEAGIEIMSPHYHSMRDGNQNTIPPGYLPKDYEAPPFIFKNKGDDIKPKP
ncbi:mechanosensitive ion channel family protein [Flavitalea flava]